MVSMLLYMLKGLRDPFNPPFNKWPVVVFCDPKNLYTGHLLKLWNQGFDPWPYELNDINFKSLTCLIG